VGVDYYGAHYYNDHQIAATDRVSDISYACNYNGQDGVYKIPAGRDYTRHEHPKCARFLERQQPIFYTPGSRVFRLLRRPTMARWRPTAKRYLNVPGNAWEYRETNRDTGRPTRKGFDVPVGESAVKSA
jgi:hypothetical protein